MLKLELRMLARPRCHYTCCFRKYNNKSRKMSCWQYYPMALTSFELLLTFSVLFDILAICFWLFSYWWYYKIRTEHIHLKETDSTYDQWIKLLDDALLYLNYLYGLNYPESLYKDEHLYDLIPIVRSAKGLIRNLALISGGLMVIMLLKVVRGFRMIWYRFHTTLDINRYMYATFAYGLMACLIYLYTIFVV